MNAKRFLCTVAAILVLGWLPAAAQAADAVSGGLKIGMIGSGRIGGTLGELWTRAGHDVMFSSLDLEKDRELAKRVGAKAGTPAQAAAFGEVLPVAVPYAALAQVGRDHAGSI